MNWKPEDKDSLGLIIRLWSEANLQVKDIPKALRVNDLLERLEADANKSDEPKQ